MDAGLDAIKLHLHLAHFLERFLQVSQRDPQHVAHQLDLELGEGSVLGSRAVLARLQDKVRKRQAGSLRRSASF